MSVVRRRDGPPDPPRRERPESWDAYLDRGEKLLWEGAPAGGLKFRASDLVQSLFGLVFGGFAIFWITMASEMTSKGNAPGPVAFFPLFGIPFVLVGAYMVFGRFFWKAYKRSKTRYALTDKRAIIASSAFGRKLKSYPISDGTRLEYEPGDAATIWFAEEERRGSKGRRYTVKHGFEYIPNGDEVYRLMRKVQQGEAV
jgi:hypothetical protein